MFENNALALIFLTSREVEAKEVLRTIAKRNGLELVDVIIVPEEASTAAETLLSEECFWCGGRQLEALSRAIIITWAASSAGALLSDFMACSCLSNPSSSGGGVEMAPVQVNLADIDGFGTKKRDLVLCATRPVS